MAWTGADVFSERIKKVYFPEWDQCNKDYLFTWNSLYDEVKELLLGTHEERDMVRKYEHRLSEHFFGREPIAITPILKGGNDVLNVKIGSDKDLPIYELGDWIQSIIMSTFPLFSYGKEADVLMFIEEPELYMHPSFQRKLVELYASDEFPNAQVYLTTHSNHLLDVLLEYEHRVSIYTVEKKENHYLVKNMESEKKVLDLLGVRNSSVFLANCVIWVEGISDRIYFQQLLDMYHDVSPESFPFTKEKHYTFAEYGGGNVAHMTWWEEESDNQQIHSIGNRNFLVCDNDWVFQEDLNSEKKQRLKRLSDEVWSANFFAEHYETENLLPYECFKRYWEEYISDSMKIALRDPAKENEALFNEKIADTQIWDVLRETVIELSNDKDEPKYYKSKDVTCLGTGKKEIANRMIPFLKHMNYSELPDMTKKLVARLAEFVRNNNGEEPQE